MPDVKDEEEEAQTAIFQQGTDVGMLARDLYTGGVDASPEDKFSYQQSVADTAKYISEGHTIIYEAAFQFDGILCAVDILVKKNNTWRAYEVKSSCSIKPPYIVDAALQFYVITNLGLPLADMFVVHLNNKYIRNGALDLEALFTPVSVLKEVLQQQVFIEIKKNELKKLLLLKEEPEMITGGQCDNPYPCNFYGYCTKGFDELEVNYGKKNIDKEGIREFTGQLQYPLYYMDFETWMSAVPECDGHWPYRQVTFQYSVHVQANPDSSLQHYYYLADDTSSKQQLFIENLLNVTGKSGSVIVYNKTFENCRLNELKNDFPDLAKKITALQNRMADLMTPFRKRFYYLPEMQGSYSIKYVLPALVPELSYSSLEIGNGGDASMAFYNLNKETSPQKVESIKNALLEYCKLDTLAMVRILEKLKRCVSGKVVKMK
ncbi:MAG: DUF2779 domain-containing protein [Ferruginibacter sp.]